VHHVGSSVWSRVWVFRGRFTADTQPPVLHLYRVLNDGTTAVSLGEWELAQSGRYISSPATMQLLRPRIRIAYHYKRETLYYVTPNICYFPLHNCVQCTVKFITGALQARDHWRLGFDWLHLAFWYTEENCITIVIIIIIVIILIFALFAV